MKNYNNVSLLRKKPEGQSKHVWLVMLAAIFISIEIIPAFLFAQPLASGRDKFLGCGTSQTIWPNLNQYWNQITPGNDGKWGSVEQVQGFPHWDGLDRIYNYAISHGFRFKEHNLVWGAQQPAWISSLDSSGQRAAVHQWIQSVCQRYDTLAFIDVVNEPFHTPLPPYKNALGGNGATGWDWVVTAFQWARQYSDSGAKLLVNEYNVLQDNTITTNYINLIDTLKVRGLIDGIGIQGHYFEFRSHVGAVSNVYVYNINTIKSNLNRIITATGLPVYMSEFDVDEPNDSVQLAQYQVYFPIFWENPGVKGITLWGYIQNDVWNTHPDTYLLRTDGSERPALQWLRHYIQKGPVPAVPILVSPGVISNAPRRPTFVWNSALHATTYDLQVALDNQFQLVLVDTTVADTTATPGTILDATTVMYWRVCGIDSAGSGPYSSIGHFTTGTAVAVKEAENFPREFALYQNYPNPFNPTTVISYQLPVNSFASLKLYDILGRDVQTFVEREQSSGAYQATFDGSHLGSGIYIYRLQAGTFTATKKLLLVK
jgi:endo-1,4-beta-xylanase